MEALFKLLDKLVPVISDAIIAYTGYRLGKKTAQVEALERQIDDLETVNDIHNDVRGMPDSVVYEEYSSLKE